MADDTNDTQTKIDDEDSELRQRPEARTSDGSSLSPNPGENASVGANQDPQGMGGGSEYGAQQVVDPDEPGEREPAGADHQHGALGGSVVAAGGGSDGPGPGQTGTDRSDPGAREEKD